MEITGRIKKIFATEQRTETFKSRDIVVTTQEQYPQDILIQFTQDKCSLLDSYQEGGAVRVNINIRGKEWTNPEGVKRYFNTIQGWRIENLQAPAPSSSSNDFPAPPADFTPTQDDDDLPF